MDSQSDQPGLISLIAAGADEVVPYGIPYGVLPLTSLDTPEVRTWLRENHQFAVYIVPGKDLESEGVPALTVPATVEDYERVISAMPR